MTPCNAIDLRHPCSLEAGHPGWRGPLVLVLFSRAAPEFDARLRALLGDAKHRNRPGGPLLVAWKARGFFKVVAPGA